MPMLRSTGLAPKDRAICGIAVAITVPSRFSMKNAPATRSAMTSGRRAERNIPIFRSVACPGQRATCEDGNGLIFMGDEKALYDRSRPNHVAYTRKAIING